MLYTCALHTRNSTQNKRKQVIKQCALYLCIAHREFHSKQEETGDQAMCFTLVHCTQGIPLKTGEEIGDQAMCFTLVHSTQGIPLKTGEETGDQAMCFTLLHCIQGTPLNRSRQETLVNCLFDSVEQCFALVPSRQGIPLKTRGNR